MDDSYEDLAEVSLTDTAIAADTLLKTETARFLRLMPITAVMAPAPHEDLLVGLEDVLAVMRRYRVSATGQSKQTNTANIRALIDDIGRWLPLGAYNALKYYYCRLRDLYYYNNSDVRHLVAMYIVYIHYRDYIVRNGRRPRAQQHQAAATLGYSRKELTQFGFFGLSNDLDYFISIALEFYRRINPCKHRLFCVNLPHYFRQYFSEVALEVSDQFG